MNNENINEKSQSLRGGSFSQKQELWISNRRKDMAENIQNKQLDNIAELVLQILVLSFARYLLKKKKALSLFPT